MKAWKRLGLTLAVLLGLTAALAGSALAAGPDSAVPAVSVQFNGKMVSFPDAAPQVENQRTFLPFRAVLEAMGAQVGFDPETSAVTAQRNGILLSVVPGEKQASITENGTTRTVELEAAAFTRNNRTYVPVRFAAEALGCSVGWDQQTRTVIIVDVDALFEGTSFALMDRFSAYCAQHSTHDNMSLTGTLTLDAADKSGTSVQPIHITGAFEGVTGKTGLQLAAEADLSALSALLPDDTTQLVLGPFLSGLNAEIRADWSSGMVYVSGTAAALALGGQDAGAWYAIDARTYGTALMDGLNLDELMALEQTSLKDTLIWALKSFPLDDSTSSYAVLSQAAALYADLFSDQAFTKQDGVYTAQTTYMDILAMTLSLTEESGDITALDLSMSAEEDNVTFSMTGHAVPEHSSVQMRMGMEDGAQHVFLELKLECVPSDKAPETLPPAGSQVIPAN